MYTVLAATSETLRQMLADSMAADIGPSGLATFFSGTTTVSLATPHEMVTNSRQGLSIWLYRIERDDERYNDPPILRTLANGEVRLQPAPLPVRLHYLVTPLATNSPDTAQRILGRVLQLFHAVPTVTGPLLRADLAGTDAELHVHLERLGLEEITRVWEALEGSYQLSVSYEVTVANIESAIEPVRANLVESVAPEVGVIVGRR